MEEGLEEVLSQSPGTLEREKYLPLDYVQRLSLQDEFLLGLHYRLGIFLRVDRVNIWLVFTTDHKCSLRVN